MSDRLEQDLTQKSEFANMLMIELLFEDKPELIDPDELLHAAEEKFGEVIPVSGDGNLLTFAVPKYTAKFSDAEVPAMVMLAQDLEFSAEKIDGLERSQLWDVRDGGELLDRCRYKCFVSDFMGGAALEYKDRCEMILDWLETVLPLFPNCKAVWTPTAGKLLTPDAVLNSSVPREHRFGYVCVNARFFNIEDTDDMIVDTLGMYAVDLPDVQLHFHGLDPNDVVNYAYNICLYNYDNDVPIESGDPIDGLDDSGNISTDVEWSCCYEDSLIQPVRTVLDIEAGEFASGQR